MDDVPSQRGSGSVEPFLATTPRNRSRHPHRLSHGARVALA